MSDSEIGRGIGSGGIGRARGRGSPDQPMEGGNGNGNGDGNGNGSAQRGRGGFRRPIEPLRTIPANVRQTAGEGGTMVRLLSNYFKLNTPQNAVVYQYHCDFEPNIESIRMRKAMLFDHKDKFGQAFIFDGMSDLKSTSKLPDEVTEVVATRRTDEAIIRIKIKYVAEVSWGHFEMIRLYNTQMRRNLQHLKYILVGRHFFDPKIRHRIPEHRLEIWQGLMTAINQHDGGILMVCDTVHKVIRSDTVYDVLQNLLRQDRAKFQDSARRELPDSIVMTSYNNKTYKIADVVFDKNPKFVFERRQGSISIIDYYKEQYQITIKDERQPLIMCQPTERQRRGGTDKPILLVPELCAMTGLTESLKNNMDIRKQMTGLTRTDPNRRVQNLYSFVNTLTGNQDVKKEMGNWAIQFENKLIELPARVLPCERIYMQNDTDKTAASFVQKSGDFGKEIRGKPMRNPLKINDWVILVTQRDRQIVDDFARTLLKVCGPLGVTLGRPTVTVLDNDRTGTFVDACKRIQGVQIVVSIVPNNNKERYDSIKKIFCCDQPVASQVVVFRTLSKKQMLMSVCTKIGIQMACKLGAEAWSLVIPPKGLMVVGYDTHHDGIRKKESVGGFVCSLNGSLTKWYSRVSYHQNREEMSNNFAANFKNGLQHYYTVHGSLPEKIVIYRDGVGDGQIAFVYDYELKQIKEAIKQVTQTPDSIKLAFVIVTKRINARFFLKAGERNADNPIPGTIVDTIVTRQERYDFYLVSQSVRQGTVAPTMYNIIEDETNWRPAHHQQLAYKLTHLYYNWMGTIRVPAPCQYAHKLAFLTGTSLHREPAVRLSDTLFYL